MRKIKSKWLILLYSLSGLGCNLLNMIMGSYLCDALMIEGFDKNIENWTYLNKTIIVAFVWSIMVTIAKIIDGVIDIPIAGVADNFKSRFGKRRLFILIGLIPMIIFYCLFLVPIFPNATSDTIGYLLGNTIWFGVILCGFYISYTTVMVTYYATFSEIVDNDKDRIRLSNYKSTFDIVYFVLGYALIPLLIGNLNIRVIALIMLPISLTMLIPFFLIKEKDNRVKKQEEKEIVEVEGQLMEFEKSEEQVGFFESLKYTFKNKVFWIWMIAFSLLQFGLQIFLTGQNVYYSGTMGFTGINITIIMACAFVPAPFMLIIYNKMVNKYGFKAGYIYALSSFLIAMIIMTICNKNIITDDTIRLVIACVGGLVSSIGIGAFFSVGYSIPSQIASDEAKKTGKSHPAMYFAVQGLVSGAVTAIATGLVWINLKDDGLSFLLTTIVSVGILGSLIASFFLPNYFKKIGQVDDKND